MSVKPSLHSLDADCTSSCASSSGWTKCGANAAAVTFASAGVGTGKRVSRMNSHSECFPSCSGATLRRGLLSTMIFVLNRRLASAAYTAHVSERHYKRELRRSKRPSTVQSSTDKNVQHTARDDAVELAHAVHNEAVERRVHERNHEADVLLARLEQLHGLREHTEQPRRDFDLRRHFPPLR